jgi:hypothetical protein
VPNAGDIAAGIELTGGGPRCPLEHAGDVVVERSLVEGPAKCVSR